MPAPGPTTLLDRVDDADQPVGLVARQDVFRERAGFRVIHILARCAAGQLLLQRLAATRERSPGRWGSSVAGYLYAGESYPEAARRRLREELGLETPLQKLGAIRMEDAGATKFIELFATRAEGARIVDRSHIDAIEFFTIAEIDRRLANTPDLFTETFPHVYRLYLTVVGRS